MFLNKGPIFAFCTRAHRLYRWFCSLNHISQLCLTYRDEEGDEDNLLDAIRDTKKSVPHSQLCVCICVCVCVCVCVVEAKDTTLHHQTPNRLNTCATEHACILSCFSHV